ncbi:MAG: phage NrS-1 polymerase family protein [Phycisphaerales bacterium]
MDSYTEGSPSGTGVKIVTQGTNSCGHCSRKYEDGKVEIYSEKRFFTVTGQHWPGTPQTVEPRQQQLDDLCTMLWPPQPQRPAGSMAASVPIDVDDQELLRRMFASKHGDAIRRLYGGDTSGHGDDDSVADLALCAHLAFWTGRDEQRMDRLFRGSGLFREKWDRADYRERTVQKAVSDCHQVYGGRSDAPAVTPLIDGPCGVQLRAVEVRRTPSRYNGRFEIWIDGQDSAFELTGSDTANTIKTAMSQLLTALNAARPDHRVTDEQSAQFRGWLTKILSRKSLESLQRTLEVRSADATNAAAIGGGQTMYEIALTHMREALQLAFVDDGGNIWSERLGRFLTRNDFTSHVDPQLLAKLSPAVNYAAPTDADPTKPIRHLQLELKAVWTALIQSLPSEIAATTLGPDSKAAGFFRDTIHRIWLTPETWMKFDADGAQPAHVERMSLASRVRDLVGLARGREPRWDRVLKGVNAFYRVEKDVDGNPVVWLGMRVDLCRGEIKGVHLSGVTVRSQHDMSTLMHRYGLADTTGFIDRLREDTQQRRICVLSQAVTNYLIDCRDENDPQASQPDKIDESRTAPKTSVTAGPVAVVTEGQDTWRCDPKTGEVIE